VKERIWRIPILREGRLDRPGDTLGWVLTNEKGPTGWYLAIVQRSKRGNKEKQKLNLTGARVQR